MSKALSFFQKLSKNYSLDEMLEAEFIYSKVDSKIRGQFFEIIFSQYLLNQDIKPFYSHAVLSFIPQCSFDILFYESNASLVCISLKTSLRERWKQADLEALRLRNVYYKSESYLLTYDSDFLKKEASYLNQIIQVGSREFELFISHLKKRSFSAFPPVQHLKTGRLSL